MSKRREIDIDRLNDNVGNNWSKSLSPGMSNFSKVDVFVEKYKRFGSITALIIFVIVIVMLISVMITAGRLNSAAEKGFTPAFKTRYEILGSQVIANYYADMPMPIPVSSNVKIKGKMPSEDETDPDKLQNSIKKSSKAPEITGLSYMYGYREPYILNRTDSLSNPDDFTSPSQEILVYFMTFNGQPMRVSIGLLTPDDDKVEVPPILTLAPSLEPINVDPTPQGINDDPTKIDGYVKTDYNKDSMSAILERFATAYAKNDQSALQQLTQDTEGRKYIGFGGFTATGSPNIIWAVSPTKELDVSYVRISFKMTQKISAKKGDKNSSSSSYDVVQVMDLLVHNPNSGLPSIVSWGFAGTWQSLEPYDVAIDGKQKQSTRDLDKGNSEDSITVIDNDSKPSTSSNNSVEIDETEEIPSVPIERKTTEVKPTTSATKTSESPPSNSAILPPTSEPKPTTGGVGNLSNEDCERLGLVC